MTESPDPSLAIRLALYQPEIPHNTGALMRLAACFGVAVDLIEPLGFIMDDKRMKRAGMDYLDLVHVTRHVSFPAFQAARTKIEPKGRLVLLTTKAALNIEDAGFQPGDTLLLGQESAGVPEDVHKAADQRVIIPMAPGPRSINLAQAGAIALFEALRQTGTLPRKT